MRIDFHTHIFPPEFRLRRGEYARRDATFGALYADQRAKLASAEDLIATMDADGVDAAVAMGLGWTDYGMARSANDYLIDAAQRYPGRIIGFAGVNPAWGNAAVREVERCADAGMRGIGELHPDTQGYDLADARTMAALMGAAQERRLIVTTHASEPVGHMYAGKGDTTPRKLMRFISNFPDATIVCTHWGGGLPFYALMPEVKDALCNVYFDSAASPFLYASGVWAAVAQLVGANKMLFGSDYALLRPGRLIAEACAAGLTQQQSDAVLGGNGAHLLGIQAPV